MRTESDPQSYFYQKLCLTGNERYQLEKEKEGVFLTENKRKTGSCYEKKAAAFLEQNGLCILERNFRCRYGEVDLIAREGECLVFVEVKYRKYAHSGSSLEAVDKRKQHVLSNAARFYLKARCHTMDTPCRFDVVGFDGEEIRWIRNAFDAC